MMMLYRRFWIVIVFLLAAVCRIPAVAGGGEVSYTWAQTQAARSTPRIIGGINAQPGDWPWMAALVYASKTSPYAGHFCGGALIHPQWVATAAHCVENMSPQSVDVVLNITDLAVEAGERIQVDQIMIHPAYHTITLDSDIALLKLKTPTATPPLKYDALGDIEVGEMGVTMGWGLTTPSGWTYPSILQQVSLPVVSQADCVSSFVANGYSADEITENMLCAGFVEGGKDACRGDSGGPLIVARSGEHELIGIVSWGDGCAQPGLFGVFTRVARFAAFISATVDQTFVAGVVTAEIPGHENMPLAQAQLSAGGFVTVSDRQGFFYLDLDPGTYTLTIDATGFVKAAASFTIPSDGAAYLTPILHLAPPGDYNRDGRVDLADVLGVLKMLTQGTSP